VCVCVCESVCVVAVRKDGITKINTKCLCHHLHCFVLPQALHVTTLCSHLSAHLCILHIHILCELWLTHYLCVGLQHNTAGVNCERCREGFYRPYGVPPDSPAGCIRELHFLRLPLLSSFDIALPDFQFNLFESFIFVIDFVRLFEGLNSNGG